MQAAGGKKTGLSQSWPLSATVLPYQKSYSHWYNHGKMALEGNSPFTNWILGLHHRWDFIHDTVNVVTSLGLGRT